MGKQETGKRGAFKMFQNPNKLEVLFTSNWFYLNWIITITFEHRQYFKIVLNSLINWLEKNVDKVNPHSKHTLFIGRL